nr:MAG TPA: hypothetical protein [Caudoviricetes sp.]
MRQLIGALRVHAVRDQPQKPRILQRPAQLRLRIDRLHRGKLRLQPRIALPHRRLALLLRQRLRALRRKRRQPLLLLRRGCRLAGLRLLRLCERLQPFQFLHPSPPSARSPGRLRVSACYFQDCPRP